MCSENEYMNDTNQHIAQFRDTMVTGENYVLKIKYQGIIRSDMRGFYKSLYVDGGVEKFVYSTHMWAMNARTVFPCFDEPHLKARFRISIRLPERSKLVVLANAMEKTPKFQSGKRIIEFDNSPIMSTYLVAFAMAEFKSVAHHEDGILYRVFNTEDGDLGNYALGVAKQAVRFFSDNFRFRYLSMIPKLDLLGIPKYFSFIHIVSKLEQWKIGD